MVALYGDSPAARHFAAVADQDSTFAMASRSVYAVLEDTMFSYCIEVVLGAEIAVTQAVLSVSAKVQRMVNSAFYLEYASKDLSLIHI